MAEQLAERGRKQGLRAPPADILIAACARHHRLELEHADAHFDWLLVVLNAIANTDFLTIYLTQGS